MTFLEGWKRGSKKIDVKISACQNILPASTKNHAKLLGQKKKIKSKPKINL